MQESITWVGLDVHKDSITAAIIHGDDSSTEVVAVPNDMNRVRRLFRRLEKRGGPIRSCYEAAGCGFTLWRRLNHDGFHCEVVAPSLIPKLPGDRRKTDRLDAIHLAKLYRSGHLTPVRVPTEEQESVRDVVRLRFAYQRQIRATKQRINAFTYRRGLVFRGTKSLWTQPHRGWLSWLEKELVGAEATTLSTELEHLEYLETQRSALEVEIEQWSKCPPYRDLVDALCCLKGVRMLTAMILATEIVDIRRFQSPRELMAWVGLVPSERSSGARERRGAITKTGNSHVRRALIEAAWNYRHGGRASREIQRRRLGQKPSVVAIALKAQSRLTNRLRRLYLRKHLNVAITAVAREMCGFVWAIMRAAPQPAEQDS